MTKGPQVSPSSTGLLQAPTGNSLAGPIQFWITGCQPYLEKGVQGAFSPLLQKFKPDHLTFSGYNLLLSTLRTWYFIFLKRSKRRKEGSRGSEPSPCAQPTGSEQQPAQVQLPAALHQILSDQSPGWTQRWNTPVPCLRTSRAPVLGSLFFQVFCFRKRVYFSLYVLWIYHNWFWQLLILLNEHIIKILFKTSTNSGLKNNGKIF